MTKLNLMFRLFLLCSFNMSLYGVPSINEGVYHAAKCDIEIKIINKHGKLYYKLNANEKENELKVDSNYLEFTNLHLIISIF